MIRVTLNIGRSAKNRQGISHCLESGHLHPLSPLSSSHMRLDILSVLFIVSSNKYQVNILTRSFRESSRTGMTVRRAEMSESKSPAWRLRGSCCSVPLVTLTSRCSVILCIVYYHNKTREDLTVLGLSVVAVICGPVILTVKAQHS